MYRRALRSEAARHQCQKIADHMHRSNASIAAYQPQQLKPKFVRAFRFKRRPASRRYTVDGAAAACGGDTTYRPWAIRTGGNSWRSCRILVYTTMRDVSHWLD